MAAVRTPTAEDLLVAQLPPNSIVIYTDHDGVIYQDGDGQQHRLTWEQPNVEKAL